MLKVWRRLPMRQKYKKKLFQTTCFLSLIFEILWNNNLEKNIIKSYE